MWFKFFLLFFMMAIVWNYDAVSQQNDSLSIGSVNGKLRDSLYNYSMVSATVALYKTKDSSIVNFGLTNKFGEFSFSRIPVATPLYLIATYTGYRSAVKSFVIPSENPTIDLGSIIIERKDVNLEEVIVRAIPPAVMNGDTLEFNADAFKLDTNAVVEDLLRKLPGITVWADGKITVYGKIVNRILVNGKPFFGGITEIATQNLPKNIVEKVQVYNTAGDERSLTDSLMEVNVKLKEGKNFGHFGKLGAGYGTLKRFEADASFNTFTSKTQISAAAAINNTNKVAGSVSTLLNNATFKGVGANIEYAPNLRYPGNSRPAMAGITFLHDFVKSTPTEQKRTEGNYFFANNQSNIENTDQTTIYRNQNADLLQNNNSRNYSEKNTHNFTTTFNLQNKRRSISIAPSFSVEKNTSTLSWKSESYEYAGDALNILNKNANNIITENSVNNFGFKMSNTSKQSQLLDPVRFYKVNWDNLDIDYIINIGKNASNILNKNDFTSYSDPFLSKVNHRKYNNRSQNLSQGLLLKYNNLERIFHIRFIKITAKNNFEINSSNNNNLVNEMTNNGALTPNQYLTNLNRSIIFNNLSSIVFDKIFTRSLFDRFNKTVSVRVEPVLQTFSFFNTSQKDFQNISYTYNKILPNAKVEYRNMRFNVFDFSTFLNYTTSVIYPGINELAPLIDSINILSFRLGNTKIQPASRERIEFAFKYNSIKKNKFFFGSFNVGTALTTDAFADSTFYTSDGLQRSYLVNVNGNREYFVNGSIARSFKLKNEKQISLSLNSELNFNRIPMYIDGVQNLLRSRVGNHRLNMDYSFKDALRILLSQSFSSFISYQENSANGKEFRGFLSNSAISSAVKCSKRLTLSTDANYIYTTSSGLKNVDFFMWNASITYRAMKGNNIEIKGAALDIFRQNKGVVNTASKNSISRGTSNMLQQYFMLTISYYPRKFGK